MITLQKISFQGTTPKKGKTTQLAIQGQPMAKPQNAASRRTPSAEALKAFYLPTTALKKPAALRFAGGPSSDEIAGITAALSGWKNDENVIGPSYFPEPAVATALHQAVNEGSEIPSDTLGKIAQQKARVQNIHNLLLNKPAATAEAFREDTTQFAQEFTTRMTNLNTFLKAEGISELPIFLFNQYASYTAPIMFSMGFPDAVAHASDVAKLTYLQAKKMGATQEQAVQALMVGWMHDPKLPGAISWSNLATHPAIANSIAQHTLTQPSIQGILEIFTDNPPLFRAGVVDALSINNDSKFVLDNVILHKSPYSAMSEPGLADPNPEDSHSEIPRTIEELMNARFTAPSLNEPLPAISGSLLTAMNRVELSTDLRGLRYDAFPDQDKTAISREALYKLLDGNESDRALWERTQKLIGEDSDKYIANPKVKGGTLTSHHLEVEGSAKLSALGLAIADPLLLSPHKVMAQTAGASMLPRLSSYINSFDNNIRFLPKDAQADGKIWRNQVLLSILASADELTGNQSFQDDRTLVALLQDDEALKAKVLHPTTWQGSKGNFDIASPGTSDFNKVLATLKTNYEIAVNKILLAAPPKKSSSSPLLPARCSPVLPRRGGGIGMVNAQGTLTQSDASASSMRVEKAQ